MAVFQLWMASEGMISSGKTGMLFDGDSKATCVRDIYRERYKRCRVGKGYLYLGCVDMCSTECTYPRFLLRCQSMIFTTDLEAERDFSETSSPPRRKSPPEGTANSVII